MMVVAAISSQMSGPLAGDIWAPASSTAGHAESLVKKQVAEPMSQQAVPFSPGGTHVFWQSSFDWHEVHDAPAPPSKALFALASDTASSGAIRPPHAIANMAAGMGSTLQCLMIGLPRALSARGAGNGSASEHERCPASPRQL
jgi:hypothetical protein